MKRTIKKVAVIGSGIMGSGIACHFANIGLEVVLLDIVPFDLKEEDRGNKAKKNSIVDGALKSTVKLIIVVWLFPKGVSVGVIVAV